MERLTFDGNFCDIALCSEVRYGSFCEDGSCSQRRVWERLKQYEDTGLEPEDIRRAFDEDAVLKLAGRVLGLEPDCLRELVRAAGVADGTIPQPSNEPPPCYQPDGDGCAYQCYDGQDEPIEKCKECPLCCSDKQRNYTSPNKSLTQADLDSMDYDKVWLDYGADGEWALVVHGRIYSLANLEGCGFEEIMRAEVASDTIGCPSGDYTVCRRPPEGEEEQDGGV